MSDNIYKLTRLEIKKKLAECTVKERIMFCRMYAPKQYNKDDILYNIEKLAEYHYDMVVDKMPSYKLDWALQQVDNTLEKKNEI
jgi:hypothetical protein